MIRGKIYRAVMKLAHKYNWHYAPAVYPDGDTMLWCKWCGFREVIKRRIKPSDWKNQENSQKENKS